MQTLTQVFGIRVDDGLYLHVGYTYTMSKNNSNSGSVTDTIVEGSLGLASRWANNHDNQNENQYHAPPKGGGLGMTLLQIHGPCYAQNYQLCEST